MNIALIGMPGSGKTSIGRQAAALCGYDFLDTDAVIEAVYGQISGIFKNKGEAYFRKLETQAVKEASAQDDTVISTGGGCVLREENMTALKKTGRVVYIERPLQKIISDIAEENRPLIKGKSGALVELYKQRKSLYEKYADKTIINDATLDKAVSELVRYINEVRQ